MTFILNFLFLNTYIFSSFNTNFPFISYLSSFNGLTLAFFIFFIFSTNSISDPSIVVATTRRNGTHSMLTSTKLSVGYLVVRITRELNKEPLLHYSSIYITYRWSVLQQCVYLMSYYSSTMLLPQGHHAMSMCPDIILFNLHHHMYTMRNSCPLISLLTLTLI